VFASSSGEDGGALGKVENGRAVRASSASHGTPLFSPRCGAHVAGERGQELQSFNRNTLHPSFTTD